MLLAMIYCLPIMASWDFFHIILMYPKEILFDCMLHTIFLLIISCLTVLFLVAEIPNHIGLEEMPTSHGHPCLSHQLPSYSFTTLGFSHICLPV